MRVLIVDDEAPARERARRLVEELRLGNVVGAAASGEEALRRVATRDPDVVLLDIRMPGMDGIEVAHRLAQREAPPAVIFTTAYDAHALAAFEANAVDYLLKPIRRERLAAALAQARRLTRAQLTALSAPHARVAGARSHISATVSGRLVRVPVDEVRYFRAEAKYVSVGHPDGEILIDDPLAVLEQEFDESFVRVHRSALVATRFVRALEKDGSGRPCLRLAGVDDRVPVSRRLLTRVRRVLRAAPGPSPTR